MAKQLTKSKFEQAKAMLKGFEHADLLHPSNYLKAGDLRGQDVTVTIECLEPRHSLKTNRGTEKKPILRFVGAEKALVLNKTNAKTIAKIYGGETLEWIGKPITLYLTKVDAFGEMVEAVRIRPVRPRQRENFDDVGPAAWDEGESTP